MPIDDATDTQASKPAVDGPAGVNPPAVDAWFAANVGARGPLTYTLIAGGRSNLTYVVDDQAGARFVLRRPPLGPLLPSAHDMAREHRILSALGPTPVPVPQVLGFCDDPTVTDRPFYVMEFVDGTILRTLDDAVNVPLGDRASISHSLVDVLASLHALDVNEIGLATLGKPTDYVPRQLHRWHTQFNASKLREVPLVDDVHARLAAKVPTQQRVSVAHGDYRLDNTMIRGRNVVAVLDWEICTLGDPLADLGMLIVYSPPSDDPNPPLGSAPTMAPGFLSVGEVTARYGLATGLDLSPLSYYVAFSYWKLACILDGVYTRYRNGAMGNDGFDFSIYNTQVQHLAERAAETLNQS